MPERAIIKALDAQLVAQRLLTNEQRIRAERAEGKLDLIKRALYANATQQLCGICGQTLAPQWVQYQKEEQGFCLYCSFCTPLDGEGEDEDE